MSPPSPKRPPTSGDRDVRKPYTPAKNTEAIPHEVPDEATGNYQGPELAEIRSRRPTTERLRRLEDFKDQTGQRLARIETHVEQLHQWKKEEREEEMAEKQIRAATEAGQVGLKKTKITTNGRIVVALFSLLAGLVTALATLAAAGKL